MVTAAGCKKEEQDVKTRNEAKAFRPPLQHCAPYRDVMGSDLVNELTAIDNCEYHEPCAVYNNMYAQSPAFADPSTGSPYWFQHSVSVSTAEQQTLLLAANNFAAANLPTGYHVYQVQFVEIPNAMVVDWFNVKVIVTYRQCQ